MKLGQLYNLDSLESLVSQKTQFKDSVAGAVLARNLTHVDPKILEKKYPELVLVNSGIEVDNSGGYSRKIQSLRLRDIGGFTTAGDVSGNRGKISLAAEDSYLTVIERESHSNWSDSEVNEAGIQGINLPQNYIAAHNKSYLREVDQIGLVGLNAAGGGLLNNNYFTSTTASGTILSMTGKQAYDEFAELITSQWNSVNNTPEYKAMRVITTVETLNSLQTKILGTTAESGRSVLAALQLNFPGVTFAASFRATQDGQASYTAVYSDSADVMKMRIPLALRFSNIYEAGFSFTIDSKYRIAGLDILEPAGGRILRGL
jgi:hypothetical protein